MRSEFIYGLNTMVELFKQWVMCRHFIDFIDYDFFIFTSTCLFTSSYYKAWWIRGSVKWFCVSIGPPLPHYSQESSVRRVRRRKFSHLTGLYHKTRCYHDLKLLLLITQNAWLLALAYDSSPPGLNPRPKLWGSDCDHLNLCLHKVLREQ